MLSHTRKIAIITPEEVKTDTIKILVACEDHKAPKKGKLIK